MTPARGAARDLAVYQLRAVDGTIYTVRDRIDWRAIGRVAEAIRWPGDVWYKVAPIVNRFRRRLAEERRHHGPTCPCCGAPHAKCHMARPCIGGCGRLTTPYETSACGYCLDCASDPAWVRVG